MIRILHAADLHLDSTFSGLSQQQALAYRQESRDTLRRMVDWANDHAVDVMLLAGDLFDSNCLYSQTAELLVSALERFRGMVFIAPGNHDYYALGSGYSTVKWPDNVHIFTERTPETVELPELHTSVTGMAFTAPEERVVFSGEHFTKSTADIRLGILHGEVTRQESKYRPIAPGEIAGTGLTYLALGHVHRTGGVLSAGQTRYAYPGCLMGRGFDETGDKGFLFGTVEPDGVQLEFVPFALRRYHSLAVDITDSDPMEAVRMALPWDCQNDICRVRLTGTREEDFSLPHIRRGLESLCAALELADETRPREDIWARCGEDSLRGLFLSELRKQYETADETQRSRIIRAVQFGLNALDKRDM